ncbi:MAG: 16S rRNA methyltransferase [Candidatus Heimdallarchaeota archaeon]|nr:16S rRNA methyltransferase [Candidatus Heimdallarchaeota archaeon]
MVKTVIIFVDSSLELIPKALQDTTIAKKYAKKRRRHASRLLLDSSYHYKLMRDLPNHRKRGRPDILHTCLLTVLGTPLVKFKPHDCRILVHTYNHKLIEFNPETRIPKNYNRFVGLMEQLFSKKVIKTNGKKLISIINQSTIKQEIKDIPSQHRMIFSSRGKLMNLSNVFQKRALEDLVLIIGGFPFGDFSSEILQLSKIKISISSSPLEAWIVAARVLYEREKTILH